jgi:hydroxypyruvate isomerase
MKNVNTSRRNAIKNVVGTAGLAALSSFPFRIGAAENVLDENLKGKINHSVCQWCYDGIPLEDLVIAAKEIGLKSVELLKEAQWPVVIKHGLTCAMGYASTIWLDKGFNDPALHQPLLKDFSDVIPRAADMGLKNLICFSGNRKGISDLQGLENCATGLDPIIKLASKYNITVSMELLNSKVDHKDYLCDHTTWGVALCEKIGSMNFKLLYDIYHMQIMEGDVIATIRKHHQYISHYHTGGVPGRHEIDETQELNYVAIMKAIVDTGFKGFVSQEFIPKNVDKIASLKQGVTICDV